MRATTRVFRPQHKSNLLCFLTIWIWSELINLVLFHFFIVNWIMTLAAFECRWLRTICKWFCLEYFEWFDLINCPFSNLKGSFDEWKHMFEHLQPSNTIYNLSMGKPFPESLNRCVKLFERTSSCVRIFWSPVMKENRTGQSAQKPW